MKKLVFSFLLFGLAGLGGYSLWAGLTAQREYRHAVHAFGEEPDVRLLESQFERGWMRSRAETQFELYGESGDGFKLVMEALGAEDTRPRVGFRMSHQIEHGPLPLWNWVATGFQGAPVMAVVSSVVEFDHESRAELAAVIGRVPSISAYTVVRSGGASETRFSAPSQALEAVTESGARTIAWNGMRGSLFFEPGWRSFVGNVRSPGFDASGPAFEVRANALEWQLDVRGGDGLPLGESAWRIGSLRIESVVRDEVPPEPESAPAEPASEPAPTEVADEAADADEPAPAPGEVAAPAEDPFVVMLHGLGMGQSGEVGAGRYAGELWLEVQRIEMGGATYGPGELRLALSDLDAAALRKLRRTTRRLEAQASSGEVSGEAASAAVAGEMMQVLPELLAQSPRLELTSLSLGLPSGKLHGTGAIWYAGNGAPAHIFDLLAGLGGELDVEAPALAVDTFFASLPPEVDATGSGADAGLGGLRKRGLVIRDGGVYRTRARWQNGSVTINGLPLETVFPREPDGAPEGAPDADPPAEPAPSMAQLLGLFAAVE